MIGISVVFAIAATALAQQGGVGQRRAPSAFASVDPRGSPPRSAPSPHWSTRRLVRRGSPRLLGRWRLRDGARDAVDHDWSWLPATASRRRRRVHLGRGSSTSPPARGIAAQRERRAAACSEPARAAGADRAVQPCHTTNGASATDTDMDADAQLSAIDLHAIWRLSRGSGQTVAVIDTGVSRHRLLPHRFRAGTTCRAATAARTATATAPSSPESSALPRNGQPGTSFGGLAPDAAIMAIRQSSNAFRRLRDPAGSGVGDVETLAMAV